MSEPTNHPLSWPIGWPRTKSMRRRGPFKRTLGAALDLLEDEIRRLGGTDLLISTNLLPRLDGRPYADKRVVQDPGVAVYFRLRGQPRVLACDRWASIDANVAAIAAHVEALRGIERWGVGTVEQVFAGYAALPSNASPSWRSVIGPASSLEEARTQYRELARSAHPDAGGSHERMSALNAAMEQAERELGAN